MVASLSLIYSCFPFWASLPDPNHQLSSLTDIINHRYQLLSSPPFSPSPSLHSLAWPASPTANILFSLTRGSRLTAGMGLIFYEVYISQRRWFRRGSLTSPPITLDQPPCPSSKGTKIVYPRQAGAVRIYSLN
jgi:hypothetical protein